MITPFRKSRHAFLPQSRRRLSPFVSHRGNEVRVLSNPFGRKRPARKPARILTLGAILGALGSAAALVFKTLTGGAA